ncbi:type I restriction endonuclease subunit S [Pantoea vagans]|jgi:type I restriction enzyme S subunit|uniref:restriction endonuclease subunit S n=1 Tax=Pantoea vagans TaxID=470934 RepID=UPI000BACB905|nr:restriction endonuclease subunit S [Pantoea vagans]PAW34398.1 type I restriction endonuclease subunit S [Pantoea vagans]
MNANWPLVRLGDYCLKIGSGATPKGGKSVYLDAGQIALIRSQNVYNDTFKPDGLAYITVDAANKLKNVEVQSGDILLNITGDSVARLCLAPDEYLPARVNQHVAIIRPDPNEFDSRFLRYFLTSPKQQELLLVIASAGATRNALTKSHIESLEVCKPELAVQIWVANQLESLDKKIQLNHQINHTLEHMAQALFKSWFVGFEPVKAKIAVLEAGGSQEDATLAAMTAISGKDADALVVFERELPEQYTELKATAELFPSAMQDSELGEIPMGWNVLPLESATSLIIDHRGKTPKKLGGDWSADGYPAISAKNIKNGRLVRHDAIKYVDPELYKKWMRDELLSGDILMTSEAPLGELLYLAKNSNYLLSQRLYGIRANNNILTGCYLYLWLQSTRAKDDINGRATGSTVVGIRQSELKKVNVMAPKKALIKSFSSLAAHYLAKIESNEKENIILENLRDTLLPKFISAEITLLEAEQAVSEVENV